MQLNLPIIIGIALADSANPVTIGILSKLLLTQKLTSNQRSVYKGISYTSGYFVTSYVTGLFLLPLFYLSYHTFPFTLHLLGIIVTITGFLELYYHINNKLQPRFNYSPLNHTLRITNLSQKLPTSPTSSFIYGMTVAIYELPLSRFLYLTIIAIYILTLPAQNPIHMLALYNTIVITPLVIITLSTYKGLSIKRYILWQQQYHSQLHLGVSLLHIILGLWLLIN